MWSPGIYQLYLHIQHLNTTFVHVELGRGYNVASISTYLNTTFVHVELINKKREQAIGLTFKYNICTCGAVSIIYLSFYKENLNTTFVHVELF